MSSSGRRALPGMFTRRRCAAAALLAALLLLAAILLAAPPVRAQDGPVLQVGSLPAQVDTEVLALTGGWYDFNLMDNEAAEFGLEYRSDRNLWIARPLVGASVTTDGAAYGYAGILTDLVLWDRLVLTPSFAAGAWTDGGSGKDLGYWLEFRSQLELTAHLGGGLRAGIYFNHVSNAGLGESNPGVEVIGATFMVPLRTLF